MPLCSLFVLVTNGGPGGRRSQGGGGGGGGESSSGGSGGSGGRGGGGVVLSSISRVEWRWGRVRWEGGRGVLWGVFNGCCNWVQPKLGL